MEDSPDTRQRLIDVAAEIFADKGYSGASVREICDKAEANPASINYYFKSKLEFYKVVLTSTFEKLGSSRPMPTLQSAQPPEECFQNWILWYMYRILGDQKVNVVSRLIASELRETTEAFELLVTKSMKPLYDVLESMVSLMLGESQSPELLRATTLSVLGQCLIYVTAAPMIEKLHGPEQFDDKRIEAIAAQISCFAIAGIKAIREGSDS